MMMPYYKPGCVPPPWLFHPWRFGHCGDSNSWLLYNCHHNVDITKGLSVTLLSLLNNNDGHGMATGGGSGDPNVESGYVLNLGSGPDVDIRLLPHFIQTVCMSPPCHIYPLNLLYMALPFSAPRNPLSLGHGY